jgi:hypothetical protein
MNQTLDLPNKDVQEQANETYSNQVKSAEKFGLPEFTEDLIQHPEGSYKVVEEETYIAGTESAESQEYSFLASVSKPLITKVFLDNLQDDFRIPNVSLLVSEVKGREQTRYLFTSPILSKYVEVLFKELGLKWTKYSDGKEVRSEDIIELEKEENFKRLLDIISEDSANWDKEMQIELLLDLTLKLSCNYPVGMMRNYLLEKVGGNVDEMQQMLKKEAESFEILVTFNDNQHWIQDRPNTAKFSEIVEVQERLVRENREDLLKPMTNNTDSFPEPFFDFTGSPLGKELISKGYKIVEKTGLYEVVTWINKLSKRLPVFMQMVSIVTIIDPNGDPLPTFGYSQTIGLSTIPDHMIEHEDGVDFHAPDEKYNEYAEIVKKQSVPRFRQKIESIATQVLS